MQHNRLVAQHIDKLRKDVDAATSQDELLEVITQVKHHPGPLDYRDKITHGIKWLLVTASVLCIILIFMRLGYDEIEMLAKLIIDDSCYWLPVALSTLLVSFCHERGWLPVPMPVNFALLVAAMVAVTLYVPEWPKIYWALMYGFGYVISVGEIDDHQFSLWFVLVIASSLTWVWLDYRANWRKHLSDKIFLRDALFNNGLKETKLAAEDKASALEKQFAEFRRGNGTRDIQQMFEGHYQGEQHSFSYKLYHFQYTVKRSQTSSDGNGGYKTKTVYEDRHRYGILLDFPFTKGLCIDAEDEVKLKGSVYAEKYHTESNAFNDIFRVQACDKLTAARFLTPAMIETLLDLNRHFISPMVEISPQGRLCIASTSKLIIEKRKHSLVKPDEFYQEIAGHTELVRVQRLLEVIHDLMRLSDNNFASDTRFISDTHKAANLTAVTQATPIKDTENNTHACS
ncbi:DUF3137 domain-containing protein [Shewanella schlegeliana]|uniref:DUF3137 domain-containing protein n=1 Tax=Shewanella schlegeliana TaxID=190308 RepID=A0ABS1SYB1_9GAMM|nr:DUF3137 domain-containing protein [Shewanella schlegeliana]MBL4913389.1 DUF3137 domain-containing protein [Shewanella schlegeliana]MCL1108278.1 DUF3137 domain-containing protein [Shewanella schlegeliana]GIU34621.1 hypothetical protein TUM4433_30960 [Shewanella schlegeliana]